MESVKDRKDFGGNVDFGMIVIVKVSLFGIPGIKKSVRI